MKSQFKHQSLSNYGIAFYRYLIFQHDSPRGIFFAYFEYSTMRGSYIRDYKMAGHAIVVVKDITLLFYHGNAVILTLW